jgi:hypothetical protein
VRLQKLYVPPQARAKAKMLKLARVLPFRNSCGILPASYHINQSYFSTKSTDAKQSSPPPSSSSKEVKVKPVVTGNKGIAKKKDGDSSKKNSYGSSAKEETERLQQFFATVQKIYKTKPNFTEEELKEHERIGKEYYRQSTIENNKFEKDLANKIWLQQEAIRALPEELRKATQIIDDTPPPPNRPWALYHTPPIKGFNLNDYIKTKKDDDDDDDSNNNKK